MTRRRHRTDRGKRQQQSLQGEVHCRDRRWFVVTDDGREIALSAVDAKLLWPGDHVCVQLGNQRRQLAVTLLTPSTRHVVGQLHRRGPHSLLLPMQATQPRLLVTGGEDKRFVVAAALPPTDRRQHNVPGCVIETLHTQQQSDIVRRALTAEYDITTQFSAATMRQTRAIPMTLSADITSSRLDLRAFPFVTIDGADARDFDDAIYCRRDGDQFLLQVAIADVSMYVSADTPLDNEAAARGNSTYFPDAVVPMLPEKLSNDLCSLRPRVDRPVFVCSMRIDADGSCISAEFTEAVIHSHARLTYVAVQQWRDNRGETKIDGGAKVASMLNDAYALYDCLAAARRRRGALDVDIAERTFVIDERGDVEHITLRTRLDSHRLIEECMLCANVSAAMVLAQQQTGLYRVHAKPTAEKLSMFRQSLGLFGLRLGGGMQPTPQDYSRLLSRITAHPQRDVLYQLTLRSLMRAEYTTHNVGHFGLALPAYTHFTSPIRRYPDLLVHRLIKSTLGIAPQTGRQPYRSKRLAKLAATCSTRERASDAATWDYADYLQALFAKQRLLGQTHTGTIVNVIQFGIFIRLHDYPVEGLLHCRDLPNEQFHFRKQTMVLVGRRSGKTYRLGDTVTVIVARADTMTRRIDFILPS